MPRADYSKAPPELANLGEALKLLRKAKGMKQIELATIAGVTESQVSDIERAKNNPGWLLIARLLDGLDASPADFARAYERTSTK